MLELDKFVNRNAEIEIYNNLLFYISEGELKNILFLVGDGGLGKTMLLYKFIEICNLNERLHSRILDFYDVELRDKNILMSRIATDLGTNYFSRYFELDNERKKLDKSDYYQYQYMQDRVEEEFFYNFKQLISNQLKENKKTAIFFDTFEVVSDHNITDWIYSKLLKKLRIEGVVFVIASRKQPSKMYSNIIKQIILESLRSNDVNELINKLIISKNVPNEILKSIWYKCDGRPILLALTFDLINEGIDLSNLIRIAREEFEYQLFRGIEQLKTPKDWAVIYMTHVYHRFNGEIFYLLEGKNSSEYYDKILSEMKYFSFIKYREDSGYYQLHDEARDLVEKHVFPNVKNINEIRVKASYAMVEYYGKLLPDLKEEQKWIIKIEKFHHELFLDDNLKLFRKLYPNVNRDENTAMILFINYFNEATQNYLFDFRDVLLNELKRYEDKYTDRYHYEILISKSRAKIHRELYEDALNMLRELEDIAIDSPEKNVEVLIQVANCKIRLGQLNEALEDFNTALKICHEHSVQEKISFVENGLGWTYRLMGMWDEAEKHYLECLNRGLFSKDHIRVSYALNSLGNVMRLQGNYPSALIYTKDALDIRERLQNPRLLGISYNTIAHIYRDRDFQGDFEKALEFYAKALTIFQTQKDKEMMSRVYKERGILFRRQSTLEPNQERSLELLIKAEEDLSNSLALNFKPDLPYTLHEMGHIEETKGNYDRAYQYFEESYKLAKEISDLYTQVKYFTNIAEMTYREYKARRVDQTSAKEKINSCYNSILDFEKKKYSFPLYYGRIRRTLGDISFEAQEWDHALDCYKQAFPLIAEHGGFETCKLEMELTLLKEKIYQLPYNMAIHWCDALETEWKKRKLDKTHIEMIDTCRIAKIRVQTIKE